MRTVKQSTAYDLAVFMTDAADHVSGKTGLTLTITASKAGGSFASISPTVTELSSGWYKVALTSSHTDTLGDLALHITGSGADPTDLLMQVRANILGDTLPANVTQFGGSNGTFASGRPEVNATHLAGTSQTARDIGASVLVGDKTGFSLSSAGVQAIWDALTSALTTVGSIGKRLVDNIDAVLSSRLASASYTAPLDAAGVRSAVGLSSANLDTQLSAIDTKTTNLPSDPADQSLIIAATDAIMTRLGAPAGASMSADVAAVKSQTAAIEADTQDLQTQVGTAGAGLTEAGGTGDQLTAVPWNAAWDAEVQSEVADALDATIADSVPADGSRPSVNQALYMLTQFMLERSVSSTTVTVKKPDGSTSLFTLTLDDATSPTSITRAT